MKSSISSDFHFDDPVCGRVEVFRAARRRVSLVLKRHDGPLLLKTHLNCSEPEARSFVASHVAWVARARSALASREAARPKLEFRDGAVFQFLGRPRELRFSDRNEVTSDGLLLVAAHSEVLAGEQLKKLYKGRALRFLRNRTRELAARFGFEYESVSVNSASGRWGSCCAGARLHFSWRLIMCSEELIDYVVLHELCHTVEMNHSVRFHALLEKCEPRSAELRLRLREAGRRCPVW